MHKIDSVILNFKFLFGDNFGRRLFVKTMEIKEIYVQHFERTFLFRIRMNYEAGFKIIEIIVFSFQSMALGQCT